MESKGVTIGAEEFHRAVNLAFHAAESQHYDALHRSMWESLPQQFALLAGDLHASGVRPSADGPSDLTLLDIGCGTGLSSELLLRTAAGRQVMHVDLLDTSPEMLEHARRRAEGWGVSYRTHLGTV